MAPPPPARSILEQTALRELAPNEFVTTHHPQKMGNSANIAYGGCTLAVALAAAHRTLPPPPPSSSSSSQPTPQYHLYTATGSYLGPALTDRPLFATVTEIRTTKSFATRQVTISQDLDPKSKDGADNKDSKPQRRPCLFLLADFMAREPASVLTYSQPPTHTYPPPENCPDWPTLRRQFVAKGLPEKAVKMHTVMFQLMDTFFDTRPCPSSMLAQTLTGIAPPTAFPTTQDTLPLVDRTSADYFRSRHALSSPSEHTSALAFEMDGALSFLPLAHSGVFLGDVGACSSLDFALRVLVPDVDVNAWLLREMRTVNGGDGRTYSEARVWEAGEGGRMVGVMSQQSILRPKAERKGKSSL